MARRGIKVCPDRTGRGFTLIEMLVVAAIIATLGSMLLVGLLPVRRDTYEALTRARMQTILGAVERYQGDVGHDPTDAGNRPFTDIPEVLCAALHNHATRSLGGGPGAPYFDPPAESLGLLNGVDDRRTPDAQGRPTNADPIGPIIHSSASFQAKHAPRPRSRDSIVEAEGRLVFLDAWGNALHYREWRSKAETVKDQAYGSRDPERRCFVPDGIELWSNGPDGINQFGAPGSDDIVSWRD